MTEADPLQSLLDPRTIALIGASSSKQKIGGLIWEYLKDFGGLKFPVNVKGEPLDGQIPFKSILEIPDDIDLAIVSIPASSVPAVLKECVEKRAKSVIVISSGFSETGEVGREMEEQMMDIIAGKSTRVLGPNTLGVFVPRTKLDTMFVVKERSRRPPDGTIAYVSQSGASAVGFMDMLELHGVGISAFIGLGNKMDISENDLIEYFAEDERTRVICLHLEGFRDGRKLLRICGKVSRSKPVVILKAGRTQKGSRAVILHTGALAGPDTATSGAFKQFGITRPYDLVELFDYSRILANQRPLTGPNIAVLTSGGGYGVISADYLEDPNFGGLKLAELSEHSKSELRKHLPAFASVDNPIDLTGSVRDEMFHHAFRILNEDPGVDGILAFPLFQTPLTTDALFDITVKWFKEGRKPVVPCIIGGEYVTKMAKKFEALGIPVYPSIGRAVLAIRVLYERGRYLKRMAAAKEPVEIDTTTFGRILDYSEESGAKAIPEHLTKSFLSGAGIRVPKAVTVKTLEDIKEPLGISFPVALKVSSSALFHKTEAGGVILNIGNLDELRRNLGGFITKFKNETFIVEEMSVSPIEALVGLMVDPNFGPCITVGIGGIFTEVYNDSSTRVVPISIADAEEMLSDLRGKTLFENYRGIRVNRDALVRIMMTVSKIGERFGDKIHGLDLNPIALSERDAVILDAKLILK